MMGESAQTINAGPDTFYPNGELANHFSRTLFKSFNNVFFSKCRVLVIFLRTFFNLVMMVIFIMMILNL